MIAPEAMSPERVERFWSKVDKTDTCWLWTSTKTTTGGYGQYGIWRVGTFRAYRYAYELLVGPVPDGLVLDHLCRVRTCVNPDHLEPVTILVNNQRGEPPTRTHCPYGHEYTPENTYVYNNCRGCRACRNRRSREWRRQKAQVAA